MQSNKLLIGPCGHIVILVSRRYVYQPLTTLLWYPFYWVINAICNLNFFCHQCYLPFKKNKSKIRSECWLFICTTKWFITCINLHRLVDSVNLYSQLCPHFTVVKHDFKLFIYPSLHFNICKVANFSLYSVIRIKIHLRITVWVII
jgi:hypothetical protein